MKLGLGTAQFGLDYGITNARGRVPEAEVRDILACALSAGVDTIDTAALYGDAEAVLGRTLPKQTPFRIVTKSVKADTPGSGSFADKVEAGMTKSLRDLGVERLYGFLFHRPGDLLSDDGKAAWQRAERMRDKGLVDRIGVSITDFDVGADVARRFPVELVQLPLNILDQRALKTGLAEELKTKGVEIHARSPFLQGVLAGQLRGLPVFLNRIREHLEKLESALGAEGLTLKQAALGYVMGLDSIDRVIVGLTGKDDLVELLSPAAAPNRIEVDLRSWAIDDAATIDPSRWQK